MSRHLDHGMILLIEDRERHYDSQCDRHTLEPQEYRCFVPRLRIL